MLEHGGRLRLAAERFGIPLADWMDLSTGIAPYHWPLPDISPSAWMRLPEPNDGLEAAACAYYGAPAVLPVAGSQAAIQALPQLRARCRVAVLEPTYAEHRQAWHRAGHDVVAVTEDSVKAHLASVDVLVVVNPNNPTGRCLAPDVLLGWYAELARRGGWLVVDEAFADLVPSVSLAAYSNRPGLIVLRSLGKFFGLGGARLGFVLAEPLRLQRLADRLGPWTITGPTRQVGIAALNDTDNQTLWRARLAEDGQRLEAMLTQHGLAPAGGCDLFQWVPHRLSERLFKSLAQRGVLVRYFDSPSALRIGLPADEAGWQRLNNALAGVVEECR